MIRIAITAEAFDAIAATLPLGSVSFEGDSGDTAERFIWLSAPSAAQAKAIATSS
jgi:hypothetical protein